MRWPLRSGLTLGCTLILVAAGAAVGDARADDSVHFGYELAHDLMSPFCPGRTLAACPSPQADELRVWILAQEAAGATREEVEATLIQRYGEEILGAPRAEGARGVSAYAVPLFGFLLGAAFVGLALRRIVAAGRASTPLATAPRAHAPLAAGDAELERWIDEELRD